MTFSLNISDLDFENIISEQLMNVKTSVQGAMAGRFLELTRENFGQSGTNRPIGWENLRSKKYAKRVGRDYATLFLSGELFDSLKIETSSPDHAAVWTENEYANTHQWGDESRNIANRPFMPLYGNAFSSDISNEAKQHLIEAAQSELERQLR